MNVRHRLCAVLVVLFGVGAGASASAHHSFSGAFDVDGHIKLTGVLSKIDWINPHIYLYLDVTGADGQVTTWAIETLPTNHLRNVGLTRQDIWNDAAAGEVVTIHGIRALDPANNSAWLQRITYADGHFFHLNGDPSEIDEAEETSDAG
jgi:hypothetical protein